MSHSEICPICKGRGELEVLDTLASASKYKELCRLYPSGIEVPEVMRSFECYGCFGLGWITVEDTAWCDNSLVGNQPLDVFAVYKPFMENYPSNPNC